MRCLFLLLLIMMKLQAEICPIESLDAVRKELTKCDQETLVLIDIGGTMLYPKDAALQKENHAWAIHWLKENGLDITSYLYLLDSNQKSWALVSEEWPHLINEAKERGVVVAAFTKIALSPDRQGRRYKLLAPFELTFSPIPGLESGSTYVYNNGVIETDQPLKGPVLQEVLSHYSPKRIVFIDDRLDQVTSVHEICEALGIPAVVFHYTPTTPKTPFNDVVADHQFRTLLTEQHWLTDEECLAQLGS